MVVVLLLLHTAWDSEPAAVQARSWVVIARLCPTWIGQSVATFCSWPCLSLLAHISVPSLRAQRGAHKLRWSCVYGYHWQNFLMLSSSHLRNSARCFSRQGMSQPRLLQPQSKQVFRQRDTEAPLGRRKPHLNGKRLVVLNQKSRCILPGMIHQLILLMKSCWLCSRMLHDSLTLVKGEQLWPSQTSPLLVQGIRWCRRPLHTSMSHMGTFNIVLRRTARMSIYHRRVHLHTQRSAPSSESVERPNAPLSILTRAPYQTSPFVSADLWLRARETTCQPVLFCIVLAGFRLHTL